jgi:uncharacterized protein with PIN domain
MENPAGPRFVADVMVGRLARWLRIAGFDVLYSNVFEDDEIIAIARRDGRIILTRDRGLEARVEPAEVILIQNDDYESQLRQVLEKFPRQAAELFSRCPECNGELEPVDKETVFDRIPPYVYLTQDDFARCTRCDRVYWHGTHAGAMERKLNGFE